MSISTFSGAVMHTDSLASLVARVDLAQLVEAYTGTPPRRSGGSFLFSCPNPAHPDRNPSFTVSRDRTGKEWARCQSACAWHGDALDLVKWLRGLDTKEAAQELRDFLGEYVPATYRAGVIPSNRVTPQEAHRLQVAEDTSRRLQGDQARGLMKRYLDSRGWPERVAQEFSLEVVLDRGGAPRVRHSFLSPDSLGGWLVTHYQDRAINTLKEGDAKWLGSSTPKTLYNLPALERDGVRAVVICEGCPDTITAHLALEGSDVAAIGCAGVHSWRKEYAQVLDGLLVVVAADNDEAGKKLEEAILSSTRSEVRLFRPSHGDLTDTVKVLGLEALRTALLLAAKEVK